MGNEADKKDWSSHSNLGGKISAWPCQAIRIDLLSKIQTDFSSLAKMA